MLGLFQFVDHHVLDLLDTDLRQDQRSAFRSANNKTDLRIGKAGLPPPPRRLRLR